MMSKNCNDKHNLWDALNFEQPLQMVGVINAFSALMAEQAGFNAIYLSGSGVAGASYGLPDLGMTTLDNVLDDVRRITPITKLPLMVDVDTGWGSALMINRVIKAMDNAGAAGIHIEDQVQAKRCGHRPNKQIVTSQEMCDRIKAAVDAKLRDEFVVMARTDAIASEGLEMSIERAISYRDAGADMIFVEAPSELTDYRDFRSGVGVPILANMTEFGITPIFTIFQLKSVDVDIVLYPLSAFRAMSKAALNVFETIRREGTQDTLLSEMQTRDEMYHILDYYTYENKLDALFGSKRLDVDQ